jgi:hypothetical protein
MEKEASTKIKSSESDPAAIIWTLDHESVPCLERETFEFLDEETIQLLIEDKIATGG